MKDTKTKRINGGIRDKGLAQKVSVYREGTDLRSCEKGESEAGLSI